MAPVKTFVFLVLVQNVLSQELERRGLENTLNINTSLLSTTDVEQYARNHYLIEKDSAESLLKFKNCFNFKANESILDIGTKKLTLDLLKKFIPEGYESLQGSNKEITIVNHANYHLNDSKLSYTVLDIGEKILEEQKNSFHHIFSFYALHKLRHKQRTAFQNIYDLLDNGGETFHIFPAYLPLYDVFHWLSRKEQYKNYLANVEDFIGAYQYLKDPGDVVMRTMKSVGFENVSVKVVEKVFDYHSEENVKKAVAEIIPFYMPLRVKKQFLNDFIKIVRALGATHNNGYETKVKASYTLIEAFGRKPVEGSRKDQEFTYAAALQRLIERIACAIHDILNISRSLLTKLQQDQ